MLKMTALRTHKFWFKCVLFTFFFFLASIFVYSPKFKDPIIVSNNPLNYDRLPVIAADKYNNVHIVWESFYYLPGAPDDTTSDLYYTNNIGGSFAPPVKINVPTGWYSQFPSIALDSQGHAHITFWRRNDQIFVLANDDIYYVTNANGNFSNPVLVADGGMGSTICGPRKPIINCDSQDNAHIIFMSDLWEDIGNFYLLYLNNMGGAWSKSYEIATKGKFITDYNACLDAHGYMHVAYTDRVTYPDQHFEDKIYYINNVGGVFHDPIVVSSKDHQYTKSPDIAVDSSGNVHIVYRWSFWDSREPNIYYVNNCSGDFDLLMPVSDSGNFSEPNIAIDDSDFIHITYEKAKLYYGNNRTGDFSFSSFSGFDAYDWDFGTKYFTLGDSSTIHFTYYGRLVPGGSDYEIFYLNGYMVFPGEPSNPSPANGAINVPLTTKLEWSTSDTKSCDVYFGTTSPPPYVNTASESNSYDPGELHSNTTYYWKIVASNGDGKTPGPEWHFRTKLKLTISSNAGGTTNPVPGSYFYDLGTQVTVKAIPNSGYQFDSWSGDVTGTSNPITINMDNDKSITATFKTISSGGDDSGKETGKGGGCFIATAAYGTPSHIHLDILRDFRDKYLMSNKIGRILVKIYYTFSPSLANIISRHKALKIFVRIHLVPFVIFSYVLLHISPTAALSMLIFIFVFPRLVRPKFYLISRRR